jgi:hypothetical protein
MKLSEGHVVIIKYYPVFSFFFCAFFSKFRYIFGLLCVRFLRSPDLGCLQFDSACLRHCLMTGCREAYHLIAVSSGIEALRSVGEEQSHYFVMFLANREDHSAWPKF